MFIFHIQSLVNVNCMLLENGDFSLPVKVLTFRAIKLTQ